MMLKWFLKYRDLIMLAWMFSALLYHFEKVREYERALVSARCDLMLKKIAVHQQNLEPYSN